MVIESRKRKNGLSFFYRGCITCEVSSPTLYVGKDNIHTKSRRVVSVVVYLPRNLRGVCGLYVRRSVDEQLV